METETKKIFEMYGVKPNFGEYGMVKNTLEEGLFDRVIDLESENERLKKAYAKLLEQVKQKDKI
jgi:hypothetical protein